MRIDDNDGQMIFGDLGGLKLPDICLTGEEKPREKPHPGILSRPGIEPGSAARQARMLPPGPQRWTYINVNLKQILLYSCETRSLALIEERWFRVFKNKVLRKIFGAKRDEKVIMLRYVHCFLHLI